MSRLNCNVIKDLLPSYIEDICSEDSRGLVEEHLAKCHECRTLAGMMRDMEIISKQADREQIDFMKKTKRYFMGKNMVSFGLLLAFLVLGIVMSTNSFRFVSLDLYYYYVMVPVVLSGTYLVFSDNRRKKGISKWEYAAGGIGIAMTIYTAVFMLICAGWTADRGYPLEMKAEQIGPFVHSQLVVIAVVHIGMLAAEVSASLKSEQYFGMLINISTAGACLALACISILKKLTEPSVFRAVLYKSMFIILAEGILVAGILFWMGKRKKTEQGLD